MLVGTHVLLLLVPGGELKDGGEAHVLLLLVPDVELDGSATGGESICFSELTKKFLPLLRILGLKTLMPISLHSLIIELILSVFP